LGDLSVCVSLLHAFEPTDDYHNWYPGTHGINLELHPHSSTGGPSYQATFLPEVIQQQGWSREETLEQLLAKAGYPHPWKEHDRHHSVNFCRYQSLRHCLSHAEYLCHRRQRHRP
jgi:AMMECR1 domain-containing protein